MESNGTVFGNKRTGYWYYCKKSVYFKSSDGHYGKWEFSWKRMNLNLLEALSDGNVLIIDSTKKGKIYPDSFTKTIPIWLCLINTLLNHQDTNLTLNHLLPSEADEIKKLVNQEIQNIHLHPCYKLLLESIKLYKLKNNKPIVPVFLRSLDIKVVEEQIKNTDYTFVLLLSAGDDHHGRRMLYGHGFEYVKGAGDDTELSIPKYVTPSGLHDLIVRKDVPNYKSLRKTKIASQFIRISEFICIANPSYCLHTIVPPHDNFITFNCTKTPLQMKNEVILDLELGKKGLKKFGDSLSLLYDAFANNPKTKFLIVDEDFEKPGALSILLLLLQRHVTDKREILLLYQQIREKSDDLTIRRCFLNKISQFYFSNVAK